MSSDAVFDVIEDIANARGKDKLRILKAHSCMPGLREYLWWAYDPFITFGVKRLPEPDAPGWSEIGNQHMILLSDLAAREVTGNEARDRILDALSDLSPKSRELYRRILLKDMRAGFSQSSVTKAFPGLISLFGVQLAKVYEEKHAKFPAMVEPKVDGVRTVAVCNIDSNTVQYLSRTGNPFTSLDVLNDDLLTLARVILKGTTKSIAIFDGEADSGTFLETVGSVRRKDEQAQDAIYRLFDITSNGMDAMPYRMRRAKLTQAISSLSGEGELCFGRVQMLPMLIAGSHGAVESLYEHFVGIGYEGVMVKDQDATYQRKRNRSWMKIKGEETIDVKIVGVMEGKAGKKYEGTLGAIVVDVDGVKARVSGMTDKDRDEIWKAFHENPDNVIGRVVEVCYHEKTEYGSLRHPRMIRFRDGIHHGEKA